MESGTHTAVQRNGAVIRERVRASGGGDVLLRSLYSWKKASGEMKSGIKVAIMMIALCSSGVAVADGGP